MVDNFGRIRLKIPYVIVKLCQSDLHITDDIKLLVRMRVKNLILLKEQKMIFNPIKAKQIYLIFLTSLLLTACSRSKKVDVSNIDVSVKIERFDHDLDAMRTKPMMP